MRRKGILLLRILFILNMLISKVWRVKALATWNSRFRASARVDPGGFHARSFAVSTSSEDGGPRRFDYKRRVLTTTRGGLVSKTRIYHKEGSGAEDDTRLAMDAISKAQFRKAEKKQDRLKRIADSSENPKAATESQMVTKDL